MYIFVSTGTRNARKKLEGISKPDSKTCLDSFFRTELDKLKTKPSVQEILTEVQNDNSKVHEFAKFLTQEGQQLKDFQEAIKLQAKSAGTNKQGLFNTLVFNSVKEKDLTDPNVLKALKPKLKAFLLAKKDADIVDDATAEEKKVANDDKTSRRKKHEDIFAKLKSSRLSNVLKVFMVLVLWDYIKIQEKKEEQKKKVEEDKRQVEEINKKAEEDKRQVEEIKKKRVEKEKKQIEEAINKIFSPDPQSQDKLTKDKLYSMIYSIDRIFEGIDENLVWINIEPVEISDGTKTALKETLKQTEERIIEIFNGVIAEQIEPLLKELKRFNLNETDPGKVNMKSLDAAIGKLISKLKEYYQLQELKCLDLSSINKKLTSAQELLEQAKEFYQKMQNEKMRIEKDKKSKKEREDRAYYLNKKAEKVEKYVKKLKSGAKALNDDIDLDAFGEGPVTKAIAAAKTDDDKTLLAELYAYAEINAKGMNYEINPYSLFNLISDYNTFASKGQTGSDVLDLSNFGRSFYYPNYLYHEESVILRNVFCSCLHEITKIKFRELVEMLNKEQIEAKLKELEKSPNNLIKQIATCFEKNVFKKIKWT